MWDQRYAEPGFAYGTEPNDFLAASLGHLPAHGDILSLAEGEGRNGVFLAQRGFNDAVVREVCLRMFAGEPAAPRLATTARPAQKAGAWRRRPRVSEET